MKTRNIIIGVMALAGFCAEAWADSNPQLPNEFTYVLEARAGGGQTNKWGFTWTSNCCPPVVRYFRQQETTNGVCFERADLIDDYTNIWWSGIYADHTITRAAAGVGTGGDYIATNLLCTGALTTEEEITSVISMNETGTRTCGGWTVVEQTEYEGVPWTTTTNYYAYDLYGTCGATYFWYDADCDVYWWGWGQISGITDCSGSTITNAIGDWIDYTGLGDAIIGTNIAHTLLSDEFTTSDLISLLASSIVSDYEPCGNATPHAAASIAPDEASVSGQAVQARFKVFAATNEHWEIDFQRCSILYSNGMRVYTNGEALVIRTDDKLEGIGTGGWIYTNVSIDAGFSTYTNNGCVYYQGAERWIEGGCGCSVACSGGSCGSTPGSTMADLGDGGVRVIMGLGPSGYASGSASLALLAAHPGAAVATPANLEPYGNWTNLTLIKADGQIRQAWTPLGILADITINSPSSFTVNFYAQCFDLGEDGLYSVEGLTPFASTTIAQGASTNELVATSDTGSGPKEFLYDWSDADQGWTLTSGGGLRKESRFWDEATLTRTITIKGANDQIVSQETKTYQDLPSFGRVLTTQVQGPGTAYPPTTQWLYYDNATTDGINYGKLKWTIEPSGFWHCYQYDGQGRITNDLSQFLNVSTNAAFNQCRAVTYDYTPLDGTNQFETRTEWLTGTKIGCTITAYLPAGTYSIRCAAPSSAWNDPANLVTITRYYTSGANAGNVQSLLNPDGTAQQFIYDTDYAERRITTANSGATDETGTNVVWGTRTVTYVNPDGTPYGQDTFDLTYVDGHVNQIQLTAESDYCDDLGRTTNVISTLGTTARSYDCCGLYSSTDRQGTTTLYLYDGLHRLVGTSVSSIANTNLLDAAGNVLAGYRVGTNSSVILLHSSSYDTAGRVVTETNALGGVTTYSQSIDASGQTIKTTTYPDGGQRIETYYQDGSLRSVTGSAVFPVYYAYGVDGGGVFTTETKNSESGSEWTKTCTDYLGRNYKTVYADNATSQSFYNSQGQVWKQVDPDDIRTLYQYNAKGELEYTAIDINKSDAIDTGDRTTHTVSDVVDYYGGGHRRTRTYDALSNLISTVETSADGLETWTTIAGVTTETVTAFNNPPDGRRTVKNYAADGSYTESTWQDSQLLSVVQRDSGEQDLASTTYGYDLYGRQNRVIDERNGTNSYTFNAADLVQTSTTPAPAPGQAAQVTTTYYNKMLQATNVIQPDNTSVFTEYFQNGLLKKQYGSRQYRVEYTYDYAGRVKTMKTWSNFAGNQSATTTWNYDAARGWLSGKVYDGGAPGPSYTYTDAGRLKTRAWARNITTTYGYNNAGDLSTVSYSDSTPGASYYYDCRGRQTNATVAAASTTRIFDDAGNLLIESYSGGPLDGLSVTNGFDQYLRRASVNLLQEQTVVSSVNYNYITGSRLYSVTGNAGNTPFSATYSYIDKSSLSGQIDLVANSALVMSIVKQYDYLNRLTSISAVNGQSATLSAYSYAYNSANQRTTATPTDNSHWVCTYDSLGQVISGKRYWPDGTPVAGQQFQYTFDDIGNRLTAGFGGNNAGQNLHLAHYSNNSLNQITSREVPGFVEVTGSANPNATVTLWGDNGSYGQTFRKGDYYAGELNVTNSSSPVWLTITNLAVLPDGTNPDIASSVVGNALVAKTPESFGYDLDGNLTNDGRWAYAWDAENRLVQMESKTDIPTAGKKKLQFSYDFQGRRIQKIAYTNDGGGYVPQSASRFVYDGWNLIARFDGSGSLVQSYAWGTDLSGTMQGAGGIDGLISVTDYQTGTAGTYFPAYDGNGNVVALVSASDGTIVGQYEFGPFGEVIRATGPMAKANPFRFSTKYQDDETDLLCYGYRSYDPSSGRFLSRDPSEEERGIGSFSYCHNSPINDTDLLGLTAEWHHIFASEVFGDLPKSIIDIDAKEYGWVVDEGLHDELHGVYGRWNQGWKDWRRAEELAGRQITKDSMRKQAAKMIREPMFRQIFRTGVRAPVAYSGWGPFVKRMRGPIEARILKLIRREAAKVAAKKAAKQGARAVPFIGWGSAVIFFACDLANPTVTFGEAVQSNIPYYGVAYDAKRIYDRLHDADAMVNAELSSTIYEGGDRTLPILEE